MKPSLKPGIKINSIWTEIWDIKTFFDHEGCNVILLWCAYFTATVLHHKSLATDVTHNHFIVSASSYSFQTYCNYNVRIRCQPNTVFIQVCSGFKYKSSCHFRWYREQKSADQSIVLYKLKLKGKEIVLETKDNKNKSI